MYELSEIAEETNSVWSVHFFSHTYGKKCGTQIASCFSKPNSICTTEESLKIYMLLIYESN